MSDFDREHDQLWGRIESMNETVNREQLFKKRGLIEMLDIPQISVYMYA